MMSDSSDFLGASEFGDLPEVVSDPESVLHRAIEKDRDTPLPAATWMALGKHFSMAGNSGSLLHKSYGTSPVHPIAVYCEAALDSFSRASTAADAPPELASTAQLRVVDCLGQLGRVEEARSFVTEHASEHSDDPEWILCRAAFVQDEKSQMSSLREIKSCLDEFSDEGGRTLAEQMMSSLSKGLARHASKTATDGNPSRAVALMSDVLELAPECLQAARVMASACWHQDPEDLPGAEKWFARCTELEPENADNWGYLGTVLYEQGKLPQALHAYEQALRRGAGDKEEHVKEKISELRRRTGQPSPSGQPSTGASKAGGCGSVLCLVAVIAVVTAGCLWLR
jgi:tetratricopeptide (TPR) repeat protein